MEIPLLKKNNDSFFNKNYDIMTLSLNNLGNVGARVGVCNKLVHNGGLVGVGGGGHAGPLFSLSFVTCFASLGGLLKMF